MQSLDLVITSGGVGPTHDDVTLRAVAHALGRPMEQSEEMAAMIQHAYRGEALTDKQRKMALLPVGVRLRIPRVEPRPKSPIVQIENAFVLPGVPAFFQPKLAAILEHFVRDAQLAPVHTRKLVLSAREEEIVRQLKEVVEVYAPAITFGSYPVDEADFKTVVTIEGSDEAEVERALEALVRKMRLGAVVRQPSKNLDYMLN
jgi:molybdopterin-biosynthesis enzyme MoeA-like protein